MTHYTPRDGRPQRTCRTHWREIGRGNRQGSNSLLGHTLGVDIMVLEVVADPTELAYIGPAPWHVYWLMS